MAAIRRSILTSPSARDAYVRGVLALKAEQTGITTRSLGIPGRTRELSTYDLLVVLHHRAMETFTPQGQTERNAAHCGPVFLPWHRFMLIFLEAQLQRVLADPGLGLPYWSWADDGERRRAEQPRSRLWRANCMGGDGDPAQRGAVTSGPFADGSPFRVRVAADSSGVLRSVDRPLRRGLDISVGLPRKSQVGQALGRGDYDQPPWSTASASFRNRLEGWAPAATAPHLHNRVHVFVGGDMLTSSSPNDPVFYLNHCNVDRVWAAWLNPGRAVPYVPDQSAPQALFRHRIDDPLFSLFTDPNDTRWTPRAMLDVASTYTYDSLAVT
jgi:tyrosinase